MDQAAAQSYSNSEGYKPNQIPAALKVIRSSKEAQRMEGEKMQNHLVQIVRLEEKQFVGVPVTSPFDNVMGIGEANRFFMEKILEIDGIVTPEQYMCLHFSNQVLFTYIYCAEVSEGHAVPDGMIRFTVPSSRYAKARSKDKDPYGIINTYLREHGMERNPELFAFEIFQFGEDESKYNADILIPIKE